MTDRAPAARARSRRPRALPVYVAMALLFAGLFGLLSVRVAQGQDPALGAPEPAQVAQRQVIVRRVIITRHITVIKPAAVGDSGGAVTVSGPASSAAPAVVRQQSAPAPAPAPAPVPAPAATTTS